MTPQEIITAARITISDSGAILPARFSDADLLSFVNQAMDRAFAVRPDLFITNTTLAATAGSVYQTIPSTATRLVEIHRIVGGDAVVEVDKATMDENYPGWVAEASGTPVNWMRHPRNPKLFYLYPAPTSGVTLQLEYTAPAPAYALGDTMLLSDNYFAAIHDCVVFLAEIVDNEFVETSRAKEFYQSFLHHLNADMNSRKVIDNEDAEVNTQEQPRGRSQ